MMTGSPEPLIYATWVETFIKMLLEDELSSILHLLIWPAHYFWKKYLETIKMLKHGVI